MSGPSAETLAVLGRFEGADWHSLYELDLVGKEEVLYGPVRERYLEFEGFNVSAEQRVTVYRPTEKGYKVMKARGIGGVRKEDAV